jgi:hypothetical protein
MARLTYTRVGVVVELNHSELTQVSNHLDSAAAGVGTLSALLGGFGIKGTPAVIAAVASGLFWFGSSALTGFCNQNQRGTRITILWVGLPFCRSL